MENNSSQILDFDIKDQRSKSRKTLLPKWIKVFSWIFIVLGGAAALSIVAGFIGLRWSVSIYGFQTTETFSILGMSIISILLFKGITAFGLLNEKDWAILFAQIDGFAGVLICVISMLLPLYIPEYKFEFRIEILFLFSYLQKMNQIKKDWSAIT